MARLLMLGIWLVVLVLPLVVSPGESQICTSQKFTNNKVYTNCYDLPPLSAYLHWTYFNSTLSIAFVAAPSKTDGWVAWAINPTATTMIGSQALVVFKSNGSLTVKTYNISDYDLSKVGTKLAYEVSELSAEESNKTYRIFATWNLLEMTEKVNHVWQVGPGVSNGVPLIHAKNSENLQAVGTLQLVGTAAPSPETNLTVATPPPPPETNLTVATPAPAPAPGPIWATGRKRVIRTVIGEMLL
uniref:DOMON domain-containing protein n=1 Tax=Fagus sylvatica TaxID=28930 RepID=A0A2N9GDI3_FAGSY